jgi:hypothetical protein
MKLSSLKIWLLGAILLLSCETALELDGEDVEGQAGNTGDSATVETDESNGAATGKLDPNADKTQTLNAASGSAVQGSVVEFPPGTLAVETDITLEEGEDLLSAEFVDSLGFDPDKFTPASGALLIKSSAEVNPQAPFTLNIPLDEKLLAKANALRLQGEDPLDRLLMFYKQIDYSKDKQVTLGLLPRKDLTVEDKVVTVDSSFYGVFQAVMAKEIITAAAEKITDAIITNAKGQTIESAPPSFNLVIGYAGASPPSPSKSLTPKIKGIASSSVESVKIYSDPDCTAQIGAGTKVAFQTTGIPVTITKDAFAFIFAKAFGASNSQSFCTNLTSYINDSTPPPAVKNLKDNATYCDDGDSSTTITWQASIDSGSGLDRYEISAGTTAGSTNLTPWSGVSLSTSAKVNGINVSDGNTYFVNIKAVDKVGNSSIASTDGCLVDESEPAAPTISSFTVNPDGTIDSTFSASDPHSGISRFEYSVGTSSGDTSVIGWTDFGSSSSTSQSITIPSFSIGSEYFYNLRAINRAGLSGVIKSVSGTAGQSLNFNGTSDILSGGSDSRLDITGNLSVQMWVKVDTLPSGGDEFLAMYGDVDGANGWKLRVERDPTERFCIDINGRVACSTTEAAPGVWNHLVFTTDGDNGRIYINGVLETTENNVAMWNQPTSAGPLTLGGWYRSGTGPYGLYTDANIDEFAMWDITLNDAQVLELYNRNPGFNLASPSGSTSYTSSTAANLQYWLPLGETWNGTTLTDQSGKSPTLTTTFIGGLSNSDIESDFFGQ